MLRKTVWVILLFLPLTSNSQYLDLSGDFNKAFGLMDPPGTGFDQRGVDLNLEAGALAGNLGVFLFYGRFDSANYYDYGFGTEYYLAKGDWYDIALGAGLSMIVRKEMAGVDFDVPAYFSWYGWVARLSGVFWVYPKIGVSAKLAYQRRPDIDLHGIVEGTVGLRIKLRDYK